MTGMHVVPAMPGREKSFFLRGTQFIMGRLAPALGAPSGIREILCGTNPGLSRGMDLAAIVVGARPWGVQRSDEDNFWSMKTIFF